MAEARPERASAFLVPLRDARAAPARPGGRRRAAPDPGDARGLLARGHHRLTIDPAAGNRAAIRAYEKAGFRPVGVMRAYERDSDGGGWHDGLPMELVVTPGP